MTQPSEPRHLYGMTEVARILGVGRNWVYKHMQGEGPDADFWAEAGKKSMLLWTSQSVDRWRAFHASEMSIPDIRRFKTFSDHNAFNRYAGGGKGGLVITWKLWWQACFDGGTTWWFSTPRGWYTSDDDGRTWVATGLEVRPTDCRYYPVNGNARPMSHVAAILRSTERIRRNIERETA